jgi:DNA-3-methyladenine glycosylase II
MANTATRRKQHEFVDRLTFSIVPVAPFRLDLTAWALRRRRQNIIDRWDGSTYRRILPFGNVPIEVAVTQSGPCDAPRLQVTLTGAGLRPEFKEQAKSRMEHILGLRVDLAPFYRMASHDAKLLLLVEKFRGVKPPRFPTIFETLANAFACQQLSLEVGLGMLSRMASACGLSLEQDGETSYAFPRPEDLLELGPGAIRELGFSGNKTLAFLELAGNIVSGRTNFDSLEKMDNEAVVASLLELRGVGRWTAEYVLLRGLKPLNVFPGDDVGARNRLAKWLQSNEPLDYDGVARVTRHWEPYAGVVYFHMLLESLSEAGELK